MNDSYRNNRLRRLLLLVHLLGAFACTAAAQLSVLDLPDSAIAKAYEQAATKNVLAAVNAKVFYGYWSVCADGKGFGYGNTYPSLDGNQLSDALLWLGQADVVKANWSYVRSFQRSDGLLPLAILPSLAGKMVGPEGVQSAVSSNGGLYKHWVPGNPLEALASITYIQNADIIFRHTLDIQWLRDQLPSVNLAASYLDSLTTISGAVRGGGFYLERPARIESDGVTQCYASEVLSRLSALNRIAGLNDDAKRCQALADRIREHFVSGFWMSDHFAEYFNPAHGYVASHGLTDVDWAAIATGTISPSQVSLLWPRIRSEKGFLYGGMPTGISTRPETYEPWEFTYADRYDLAAMGRVWYLEAWARARMGDAQGLIDGLHRVCDEGRKNGYTWRERYQADSAGGVRGSGPNTYCEYPANLIRIVQEFLLGVDLRADGSIMLAPTVTDEFWRKGFGQTVQWTGRTLSYHMTFDRIEGTFFSASPFILGVRLPAHDGSASLQASIDGRSFVPKQEGDFIIVSLPLHDRDNPGTFEIVRKPN